MSARTGAGEQLRRILHILPAAAREGGAALAELASALGVEESRVLRDLEEITARSFYHPAGGAEDLQILIEGDRVRVWTGGEFRRPVKLDPREVLAAALGLRAVLATMADGADGERSRRQYERLLARLEGELSSMSPDDVRGRFGDGALEGRFALGEVEADPEEIRARVLAAARERRPCRILYLKPDAAAPEERTIHPWVVAHGEGVWYAIGANADAEGARVFRLDRILAAEPLDGAFEPPADFDAQAHLGGGRVFVGAPDARARVRYSPRIARWIAERMEGEEDAQGGFVVSHALADAPWLVRHALSYGADAEVLEPVELRGIIGRVAERMGKG